MTQDKVMTRQTFRRQKKKSNTKVISGVIVNIVLVISVVLLALASYSLYKGKNNQKNEFLLGYKPVIVQSGSMEPNMRVNGLVLIKKVDIKDVKVGDIITYQLKSKNLVTHRVVGITPKGLVTKGDANEVNDQWFTTSSNFIGEEVVIINWVAPVLEQFEANPLMAAFNFVLLPMFALYLISFIISTSKKLIHSRKVKASEVLEK